MYGAGLLSSFGELEYCKSSESKAKILPFQPEVTALTEYYLSTYQSTYFVTESFEDAKRLVSEYVKTMNKPFRLQYNPKTESIEILKSFNNARKLA